MLKRLPAIALFLSLNACGLGGLPVALERSIMDHPDPELVSSAVPAYLLMLDTLAANDPDNSRMQAAAAKLYAFYATSLSDNVSGNARLAQRSRHYGFSAVCLAEEDACDLAGQPFDSFQAVLNKLDEDELPELYALSVAWLAWLQTHSNDMRALAELPRVELALQRVLAIDETWEQGAAHLYLGILKALRPPALGGRPQESRTHFERALLLSNGNDLSFKVAYARYYARGTYDRNLHDQLLLEVLDSDPNGHGRTLVNTLAQTEAQRLLDSADSYF